MRSYLRAEFWGHLHNLISIAYNNSNKRKKIKKTNKILAIFQYIEKYGISIKSTIILTDDRVFCVIHCSI